jgi:leucyl-tRNA synthetase
LADPKVRAFLNGQKVRRTIYVPRRLVNIVVED